MTYHLLSKKTHLMLKPILLLTLTGLLLCSAGCNKKTQTSGETGYRDEDLIITSDNYDLPATICIPDGEGPFPAVVMLHGTGSNRNEAGNGYVYASHELASKYRIASVHIDFPGSDLSDADSTLYEYDSAAKAASDAADYIAGLENIKSDSVGVMGWSQGGTIALLAAGRYPDRFKSVVTWSGAPDLMKVGLFSEEDLEEALEKGYFLMNFDFRDSVKTSLNWCEDVMGTDVLDEFEDGYKGPVLAIAGTADTTVDPEQSEDIVDASDNDKSRLFLVEGMDHTLNIFSEDDKHTLYKVIDETGNFFTDTLN